MMFDKIGVDDLEWERVVQVKPNIFGALYDTKEAIDFIMW